ncbi:MAG: FtsQ-type POTRA domain-containing protein, partial [Thermoleophilia bacterium]
MPTRGGARRLRLRVLPTVLLTVAILGLPGGVYAWGRSSSSFAIRQVDATGTRITPPRRVARLLRHEFLGRNLFTVTESDVRRALAPLRYVASVSVDRDFPDALRVTVVEHRPAAYALAGGRWYVVADDGFVVRELVPPAAGGRPGAEGADLAAGPPGGDLPLPRFAVPAPVAIGSRLD